MTLAYSLTPELRRKLKDPLGTLIRGPFIETMGKFKEMVDKEKPTCIISVGDTVSKNLQDNHVFPQLLIVDNLAMRKSIQPISLTANRTVHVKNPRATITEDAVSAIRDSLRTRGSIKIVIDGEEDLLTLIAILYAPENAFVVYGQPYEGIVVVKVTQAKKAEMTEILKTMVSARKAK
jgi:uncharacterized protein (UPF0218 family)